MHRGVYATRVEDTAIDLTQSAACLETPAPGCAGRQAAG
jgi:hypothetical protein